MKKLFPQLKISTVLYKMSLGALFFILLNTVSYANKNILELPELKILWKGKIPEKTLIGDRLLFELDGLNKIDEAKILKLEFFALTGGEPVPVQEAGFLISELESKENSGIDLFELIPLSAQITEFPPLILYTPDGNPIARTNAFSFKVHSAFVNPQDPKEKPQDYIPPVYFPFPRDVILFFILLTCVFVLLFFVFFFRKILKRKKKPKKIEEDRRRPDEKLLDELKIIENKNYIPNENFKKLYLEVSEVLKDYLSFRYKIQARDATTEEILELLHKQKISEIFYKEIKDLFIDLDKVKFARFIPTAEEALKICPRVREYIQRTRIRT